MKNYLIRLNNDLEPSIKIKADYFMKEVGCYLFYTEGNVTASFNESLVVYVTETGSIDG